MSNAIAAMHRTGIGGSMAAAIVGVSRHKTQHDVLAEILGMKPEEPPAIPMRVGTHCEPLICQFYEEATGFKGWTPKETIRHPKYDFIIGHVDWLSVCGTRGMEAKVAGLHTWSEWKDPAFCQVPIEYLTQCYHYAAITSAKAWDLCVLLGTEYKLYPVELDAETIEALIEREVKWWERHVINKEPLPIDGSESCRQFISWQHPTDELDLEWAEPGSEEYRLLNLYADVRTNYDAEKANKEELENKIRAAIGNREGLKTDRVKVTWRARKDGVRVLRPVFNDDVEGVA